MHQGSRASLLLWNTPGQPVHQLSAEAAPELTHSEWHRQCDAALKQGSTEQYLATHFLLEYTKKILP